MTFSTGQIRNIAFAGHVGTGKTSFVERLLFQGQAIQKPETVESGRTVSDYSDEEISRKISIHCSLSHAIYSQFKLNFLDTPGASDFVGEVILALRSVEMAMLVVDGKIGVQIETIKLLRLIQKLGLPFGAVVSKLDQERASFAHAVSDIAEKLRVQVVPVSIPIEEGGIIVGIVDLINLKAYRIEAGAEQREVASAVPESMTAAVTAARSRLCEAAADGDDALMEKYLLEGSLSQEELVKGLKESLEKALFVPAFATAALKNCGMQAFLDFAVTIGCDPTTHRAEKAKCSDNKEIEIAVDPSRQASALVVKTQIDQFSGKLSYLKMITGVLRPDSEVINLREGGREKVNRFYIAQGKKLEEVPELCAGDIGVMVKSAHLKTNDTLSALEKSPAYLPLTLPTPVYLLAIAATNKNEDDKLNELLIKASEEDLTFQVHFNSETHETVIAGMGELQIRIILDKIKNATKITADMKTPRVAYRETITKPASAEYTHKKQTGGHGQYARVVFDIMPLERGTGYQFENKIFGGVVSRGFMPGIEKGIHQAMENGVIAGYPVVDVKTAITDGKEHPVDSSEMAFKLAARGAFREASRKAASTLLEPIMNLHVFVEEKNVGDIMSDLSGRRGRISGQNLLGGSIIEIDAQVPQAELLRYAIDLRAMTSGTGSFEVEFDHYAPITGKIAEDVIKAAQAFKAHVEEEE